MKESKNFNLNGLTQDINDFDLQFQSRDLEANQVFPRVPKSSYISSDYTPSFDFPFNPDPLARGNSYVIYDEMRHDDQIKAALNTKKNILISSGWDIKCENPEISDSIKENLQFKMDSSFEDSLRDLLSAFDYGFSMSEVIYRRMPDGKFQVRDIKTRPPHGFEFDLDSLGDIIQIRQNQQIGDKVFNAKYFLDYIYQSDFKNPYGNSDLRAAHQSWVTKKFFLRMWAIYVERFASPTVLGKAPKDAGPEERNKIFNMMKTLQNSTIWMVPDGTTIDFMESSRDSSGMYSKAINDLNTMIARAILLPDLLGMSGDKTTGGSFSLGQTQFRMFLDMIRKEQRSLERKINLKIIRPMVLANWGDIPCTFKFNQFSEADSVDNIKMWVDAVKGKIWTPTDEEINHFRETIDFPISDQIERPNEPTPISPQINPIPSNPKRLDDGDDVDNPGAREAGKGKEFSEVNFIQRTKTKFEEKLDFQEITKVLERSDQRIERSIRSAAKDISDDLLDQIKKKNMFIKFKPDAFNEIKPRFQRQMKTAFKVKFQELFKESFNMAQKEFFRFAESKFAESEELLPEEFLELIDSESFKMVGDYSTLLDKEAKNTLVSGIKAGKGERETLKDIRESFELETDKWLKTVIRTKSTEMFNRGRKSFYDNDPIARQIVEAFQYSAIIDSRTSSVCSFLDGKIFIKGELTNDIVPPLHFNCRSILVPVTRFENFKDEKKFIPPNGEPSTDRLKELGGNLIP